MRIDSFATCVTTVIRFRENPYYESFKFIMERGGRWITQRLNLGK